MSKAIVLLTGATGHIGFRTLVLLLQADYAVRIAIRKAEQEDKIRNAKSIQPYSRDIEFILVPDMTAPNAYKTAIEGMQYVIHVASPIPLQPNNQALTREGKSWAEVYYEPAVKGTLEILTAAKNTPSVERVVITSSGNVLATAVGEPGAQATDIRQCPTMAEAEAVETAGVAYKTSKILAITAARDFMRSQQQEQDCKFTVVYVCPGYVQGAHELCENVDEFLATTSGATLNVALGKNVGVPNVTVQIWVDDVARAHILSLTSAEVKNGDVLVLVGNSGKGWDWDEVGKLISERFTKEVARGGLKPVEDQQSLVLNFDASGTEKKLGWQFQGPDSWATDVVEQYLKLRESHPK
jgi:nucleoside-diphosphate-sugar epimerase